MKKVFQLFLLFIILFSCKKNEVVVSSSTKDLLINKYWRWSDGYSNVEINDTNGIPTKNYYNLSINQCLKDDYIIFYSEGTGTINYGKTKCSYFLDSTLNSVGFTWNLKSENKILYVSDSIWFGSNILSVTGISSDKINLNWNPSNDNIAVYSDTYSVK